MLAQLQMVIGGHGCLGQPVVSHVVGVYEIEPEAAIILPHMMMDRDAGETPWK